MGAPVMISISDNVAWIEALPVRCALERKYWAHWYVVKWVELVASKYSHRVRMGVPPTWFNGLEQPSSNRASTTARSTRLALKSSLRDEECESKFQLGVELWWVCWVEGESSSSPSPSISDLERRMAWLLVIVGDCCFSLVCLRRRTGRRCVETL